MEHENLLNRIMELDENIRFAGICDMDGHLELKKQREGIETLLSPDETQDTLLHAVSSWKSRMKHYDKTGKSLYTLAVYEKLRRVTVPLPDNYLLLVTIGKEGGQKQIVDMILSWIYGDFMEY